MKSFDEIYRRAVAHKGEAELEAGLPKPKSARALARIPDDRWLAEMTRCVFRAGFVWKVVEAKWPGFEAAFGGFDVTGCAMASDEDLEQLAKDDRIIKNPAKIRTVRGNAQFIAEVRGEHGGFGRFIANWPGTDIVGLLELLKKRGQRLGGNTGPMFLRMMGRDTFMFSPDVVKTLIECGVIDKPPTSKKALAAVQGAFNEWARESGRPLCQISRILAAAQG